jgi:hypothetical protein
MRCHCCEAEIALAGKVRIRSLRMLEQYPGRPGSAAHRAHVEALTFRWAVVCLRCYSQLDNALGAAEINGQTFNLAGGSRHEKAAVFNEAKYQA